MLGKKYVLFALAYLFCEINCLQSPKIQEEQCLYYFTNGDNFDLDSLYSEMYAVYYWPPNARQKDTCEVYNFKKLNPSEIYQASNDCNTVNVSSDQTVMRATYKNSSKKIVNLLYYGDEEVKNLYRSCDRILSKIIFRKVNDDYVLGINCSSGGRGVLLSRNLPTLSQVQSVVNGIDIMTGRNGSPDCKLSEY